MIVAVGDAVAISKSFSSSYPSTTILAFARPLALRVRIHQLRMMLLTVLRLRGRTAP